MTHCCWPSTDVPCVAAQSDHLTVWREGGCLVASHDSQPSTGSQGRRNRLAALFPHPPFNPYVRFSRIRLTDGLLDMVTPPSGKKWCP